MAMTSKDVHLLTHTARMLMALAEKPKHVGGPEYRKQIATYATRWQELAKPERAEAIKAAAQIGDMTDETISAAVAALEG